MNHLFTGGSNVSVLVFLIGHVKVLFNVFDVFVDFLIDTVSLILERSNMDTILDVAIVTVGLSLLGLTHVYKSDSR